MKTVQYYCTQCVYFIVEIIDKQYTYIGKMEVGGNASSLRIEPIRTCFVYGSGVMPGRRTGSGVGKYNAKIPNQGSKRFNSVTKTIYFAHVGILFIFG